jgi:uncharacterized protein
MAIRATLGEASSRIVEDPNPPCRMQAGCFVTLRTRREHRLRGCIGQLSSCEPLTETVVEMARSVLRDPRFTSERITLDELGELEIELTILSPLEAAGSVLDFDLLEDGIYLQCHGERGCFLPQVARETGWDKETLLGRLCTEKMGLPREAWRDPSARLMRFSTFIVGPEPLATCEHEGAGPGDCL